jgi:hypothetical protein
MNSTATAVYITADVDIDFDGDEIEVYNVYVGDDDAEALGTVYTVRRGRAAAFELGEKIAADRHLELVAD